MTPGPCGLCGRAPAAGNASVTVLSSSAPDEETWYCHGDDDASPTCYETAQRQSAEQFRTVLLRSPRV